MDLNGKIVLVAGGAGGIGLGIAKALAAEGCRVALADANEEALINAAKATSRDEPAARQEGGDSSFAPLESRKPQPLTGFVWRACDITQREQVSQLFQWLGDELGPIDILVNSAGINVANRMMSNIDPSDFDRVMEVNTTGTFNCIYAALPVMRRRGSGLIVNIVSIAGKRAMLLAGLPYCVSKFAASALGTFVNLEECGNGIKVTNIYPGETNTPIVDKRPSPPPPEKRARMLQPQDIAACVVAVAKLPPRAVVPELIITPPYMMIA
ncbi:MAG: SDR family oxidoreductase [Sedimentisphaerales bacterium]|jgi:NAD(P)-dependent dehydrogenase (short-subunit alcohol dehydrogenase family)